MNRVNFGATGYMRPEKSISEIVLRLVPDVFDGEERRQDTRYPITMNATVVEIDENYEIASPCWNVLTSTISESGIGFVSSRPAESELLVVEVPVLQRQQFLVQVAWQQMSGQFHCIGSQILERLQ